VQDDVPDNCDVLAIDLEEFKKRAYTSTGVLPTFSSPYKLCDYKPAFGHIFQKELDGCDFWGFCDTDVILGDLKGFLCDLLQYDVFSTRSEYLSGPLFLMRNCETVNYLYQQSKDCEKVLSKEKHYCFDECAFAWGELHAGLNIINVETEIESMTEVIVKANRAGLIKAHFFTLSLEPERDFRGKVNIVNGHVLKDGNEYIHFHHLHLKGRSIYTFPAWSWRKTPSVFFINRYGVYGNANSFDLHYRCVQFVERWRRRVKKKLVCFGSRGKDMYATKIT